MFPLWATLLFALLAVTGSVLLLKSIGRMMAIYHTGTKIETSALVPTTDFTLTDPGSYEISVKRPALTGVIPTRIPFELTDLAMGEAVVVHPFVNLLSQRKDLSGSRMVPIAEFTIAQSGSFRLTNPETARFKTDDRLLIMPKTGSKGFVMIFAILFSAILFIGGFVLFILGLVKK